MQWLGRIRRKGLIGCIKAVFRRLTLRARAFNTWEGNYSTWAEALNASSGYDDEIILEKVLSASLKVKNGEVLYERDSVAFDRIEYSWPLLAGLMWGAATRAGTLRIIDFGGALGSTYRQNKLFLNALSEVRWNVVEQSHFVSCGQNNFINEELSFFNSIEECLAHTQADGILFSSVLQYLEHPYALLNSLNQYRFSYILVDRTPFASDDKERITVQYVPENIYKASYPCHFLSQSMFLKALEPHYQVVEWFTPDLEKNLSYKGCILRRKLDD